ncbi:MAG TPA: NADH-quinone oxidoreductase subunit C [Mycobacteriales bacterium]|nr:NADH-quinone oxidoreductase subunit C [Mycobacteriales bacterium]
MTRRGRQRATSAAVLSNHVAELLGDGYRLALVAAHDDGAQLRIVYLLVRAEDDSRIELVVRVPADDPTIPSLAALSYPAGRFEREMHDLFGVIPSGHPLPRRLVRHGHWPTGWYPLRRNASTSPTFTTSERFPFRDVQGPAVFEIPVGPVHASLIEPGHFRFSVVGETVLKLKARLWFVHRGIEKLFEGRAPAAGVALAERISGDTAVGHNLAFTLAVEDAAGLAMPTEGARLRAVLLELERVYNHVADLGALANDAGFGLAHAHALTLRERLLRLNAGVTGHRLLRGAIAPGEVHLCALPDLEVLRDVASEAADVAELTLAHSVVSDRFTGTGVLTAGQAADLGCLGPVARATGLDVDARFDHPSVDLAPDPVLETGGDVLARYLVRSREISASVDLIARLLDGMTALDCTARRAHGWSRSGVGLVEGWRGTISTRIEMTSNQLGRVKIVDPSWFNWPALPLTVTDAIVPDFPLINKSFNLSYAGNDL